MHIPESLQDLADGEAVQFLKRPKTIIRIIGGVFSLIIFSSLLTDGYQNKTESSKLHCVLNSNNVACSFAVGAGLLAFLNCLTFLALDAHESCIGNTRFKTAFQLLDFILAVLWTGIWFVGSCFLANQWQHSPPKGFLLGSSGAKAAITFAFFSICIWVRMGPLWGSGLGAQNIPVLTQLPWEWGRAPPRASASLLCDWANWKEASPYPMQMQPNIRHRAVCPCAVSSEHNCTRASLPGRSPAPVPLLPCLTQASLWHALSCPQIFQAYAALHDLRNDTSVPYKRSLDEGGVVLTTLSPPSAASPANTPTTGPNNPSYASSALPPYLTTPKAPRLAMMPDN
ncbi:synaptogyrin-4 isoform X1 [Mirounga angustirostris]|uniref:synaptogyrin-4 isoform X1 n=1 Tax=Mirounga angustirostris TaxID=9716 RepID=UPI00313DDC60